MEELEHGVCKLPPNPELDKLEDAMYMSACNAILSDSVQLSNEDFPNNSANQEFNDALSIGILNSTSSQQRAENEEDILNLPPGIREWKIDSATYKTGAESDITGTIIQPSVPAEDDITIIYDKAFSSGASQSFMSPEVRNDNKLKGISPTLYTSNQRTNLPISTSVQDIAVVKPSFRRVFNSSISSPSMPIETKTSAQHTTTKVDEIAPATNQDTQHRITSHSTGSSTKPLPSILDLKSSLNNFVAIAPTLSSLTQSTVSFPGMCSTSDAVSQRFLQTTNAAAKICGDYTVSSDRTPKFFPGLPKGLPIDKTISVQRLSKEVDKTIHIPDPPASHRIISGSAGYPLQVSRIYIPNPSLINNPTVSISKERSFVRLPSSSTATSPRSKVVGITGSSETLVSRSEISNSALSSAQSVSTVSNPCLPNSSKLYVPKIVHSACVYPVPSGSSPIPKNGPFNSDRTQGMKRLSEEGNMGISTRKKTVSKSVQTDPIPPSLKYTTDTHKCDHKCSKTF